MPERVQINPDNRILLLNRNRVGNGGFSLRSHRLAECSAQIDFDALDEPLKSEDLVICHFLYEEMRAKGIAFAPPDLAAAFSIESPEGLYGQHIDAVFGFHGKHLLLEAVKAASSEAVCPLPSAVCTPGAGCATQTRAKRQVPLRQRQEVQALSRRLTEFDHSRQHRRARDEAHAHRFRPPS